MLRRVGARPHNLDVITEASMAYIRVIHHLTSLLVSQTRSLLCPHVNDVGASKSITSSHVCVLHTCVMCKNICLGLITDSKF